MSPESKSSLKRTLGRSAAMFLIAVMIIGKYAHLGLGALIRATLMCVLLGALCAAPCSGSGAEPEHWRNVKGAALKNLFKEKEFGDGVHFAYQFRRDGTFTGTEMAKTVSGSWEVRNNEFCWKWLRPPGAEECYEVQQDGKHIRLIVNRSEAWYGTLEPLR